MLKIHYFQVSRAGSITEYELKSVPKLLLRPSSLVELPKEFELQQNYPNPFNPTNTFEYSLPVDSKVRLDVYSTMGQLVAVIRDGVETAGYKETAWSAIDVASGVYYYRLETTSTSGPIRTFAQVKKMILMK